MPSSFLSRRRFLSSTGMMLLIASAPGARAAEYAGALPWKPFAALPPDPPPGGRWYVFTPEEARTVEAVVDRLIPADELSIGGKEAGCASFIDRQLAGSYGSSDRLYMQGPFAAGLPTQGYQGSATPAGRYREGLAALNKHARATLGGKAFFELAPAEQDKVLQDFEAGKVEYKPAAGFFNLVLQNTMEGFFADPIYGGNKDMAGWKFIGFPGARYDYRDYVTAHNKPFPLPPLSIAGRPEWKTGDK
ncbi:MAG: gluconate 2-dehydrogenase subunit 3 family protein [Bosea sp.]|uniref:gluconate 2-dehydrogenase subunit 3 family protein n=1 Tax=unclassified Bosea (in: a-proteobacteria) TaxID=2653178 RepID=UPI00095A60A5|nr:MULTISPECIES: gluconate 2-dehydrogenase subunit 3 family protein [unclassified Bosea (in: a-proteobacteria)]MBN9458019.1 gluconate 2-dehydrogenase subunit 3 family protein [Bosea sp. (in: a-proteobacteria)]OJV10540.1 MAG: gluconate 2-dehydrogenase [Bosea sp. 67-29]